MTIEDLRDEIKVDLGIDVVSIAISDNTIELKIKEALRKISSYAPRVLYMNVSNAPVIDMPEDTLCVVQMMSYDLASGTNYVDNDVFSWTTLMYNSGRGGQDPFSILQLRNQVQNLQSFVSMKDWMYDSATRKLYLSNVEGENVAIKYMVPYKSLDEVQDEIVLQKIKEYALALCKIIEGTIRRKTQSAPGAIQLDGDSMVSEGESEKSRLDQEIPEIFKYLRMGLRV